MDLVLHQRSWGTGAPVIALHPLGLDSSGFAGFGRAMARRGLRTIAVDLPGFGRSPAAGVPLTPAVLAAPVIALARELEEPPVVMGISLGARVALETALRAPDAVRAVIAVAPALPWLRFRFLLPAVRLLDPERAAKWLPLEYTWPLLRWLAATLEELPYLRDDELAQAGARLVYYMSCPATRASFASAAREMVLEPALGRNGFWTRLKGLAVPALFVWGERDRLVSASFAHQVALTRPEVPQLLMPCVSHWINGPHHRCLAEAMAVVVEELRAAKRREGEALDRVRIGSADLEIRACIAHAAAPRQRPACFTTGSENV
jgi:pimeloyl-ACP methyl ester carboxylesterase